MKTIGDKLEAFSVTRTALMPPTDLGDASQTWRGRRSPVDERSPSQGPRLENPR